MIKSLNRTRIISAFFALTFLIVFSASAFAVLDVDRDERVYDFAGLLSQNELDELRNKAISYSEELRIDFVAVITNDLEYEPQEYAEGFFSQNIFGYGDNYSGMILYLNMESRDVYIATSGECKQFLKSADTDYLLDRIVDELTGIAGNPVYLSVNRYLDESNKKMDEILRQEAKKDEAGYQGMYGDAEKGPMKMGEISTYLSIIFAGFMGAIFIVLMLIVLHYLGWRKEPKVGTYLLDGKYNLYHQKDVFLTSHTSKVKIPKDDNNNNSSGGRSSIGRSTGGGSRSFGGGGRKF